MTPPMRRCFRLLAVVAAMSLPCVAHAQQKDKSLHPATGKFSRFIQQLLPSPLVYGGTDVNLITGTEIFPNVTQSGTFTAGNPDNPLQIVVAYIDSRGRNAEPNNIGGASVSTDGGNTFVRVTRDNGQSPFDNTLGGPVLIYNRPFGAWFTVWLDEGCGNSASATISPSRHGTPIAGLTAAFTASLATRSLAGQTITRVLHSTGACTFLGTTTSSQVSFLSVTPPITVSLGRTRNRSRRQLHP